MTFGRIRRGARTALSRLAPDPGIGTANEATRQEWVSKRLLALPAGSRLLDAGAGERPYRQFCRHLDYVSQDFGRYDGTGDGTGLQTGSWDQKGLDIVSDIVAIPEPDASFDVVLCTEVLEHVPDPVAALRELGRLTKMGGEIILTSPFASLTHFAPLHYSTGFARYWYEHHLDALGFKLEEVTPNGSFEEYLAQELRRLPDVVARFGGHPLTRLDRLARRLMLRALARVVEPRSSELLAFGWHVRARKVREPGPPRRPDGGQPGGD